MYGVVREFQSPQGVTHAARGRFGSTPQSQAVIFARKTTLDLYIVRANPTTARLEHISSTPLGAPVHSLAVIRRPSTDILVLGFCSMRIAILSWLHDERSWQTDQLLDLASLLGSRHCSPISIMQNLSPDERGKALLRGSVGSDATPEIRTDPSGRCLAVLAREQSALYVVPMLGEDDSRLVNRGDVFLIDLPTEHESLNVKDFTFLHDSFEPNILILYEPKRTWAGRAAIKKDTCCLLNITVDLRSKRTSKTWSMEGLPYDCDKLVPIPESAEAGALVISASVILQVRHGACVAGLSLNCFGDDYAKEVQGKYDTITSSDQLAECDVCHCRFLDVEEMLDSSNGIQSIALLSLKGGELYFLSVAVSSRSTISMKRAGSTVIASEIVPINDRFFVLASRLSDSLLIEYQPAAEDDIVEECDTDQGKRDADSEVSKPKSTRRKKRKRTAEEEAEYEMIYGTKPPQESSDEESEAENDQKPSALELEEKVEGTRGVYDDEDELGWVFAAGTETGDGAGKGKGTGKWALKVKDTLPCFGPGADLAVGPSPEDVTATKLDMVIAGGYGKNGCLAVVHQTVRPTYRTEFEVNGCNGVWALLDPAVAKKERAAREKRNKAVRKRNEARKAHNSKKLADRQIFIAEAIVQLSFQRKEQEARDAEGSKPNQNTDVGEPNDTEDVVQRDNAHEVDRNSTTVGEKSNDLEATRDDNAHDDKQSPGGEQHLSKEGTQDDGGPPAKRAKTETSSPTARGHSNDSQADDDRPLDTEVLAEVERQAEANYPLEPDENMEDDVNDEECLHSYLLLSTPSSTTILKTGVVIEEVLDNSVDFVTTERTIAAQNVFNNDSVVQVVPTKIRVLHRGKIQCEYSFADDGKLVKRAQVCDPLVLVQTDDDHLFILSITAEKFEESPSDDSTDEPIKEDLFDEYGMPVSGTERTENAREDEHEDDSDGTSKPAHKSIGYRDFKIRIEFSKEQNPKAATSVAAAYVYKGSLASEVAKDGVLLSSEEAVGIRKDNHLLKRTKSSEKDEKVEDAKQGELVEENKREAEEDRIDDEDRMLYGDDNEDEENLMLYGTGDTDGDDKGVRNVEDFPKDQSGHIENGAKEGTDLESTEGGGAQKPALLPPEKGVQTLPDVSNGAVQGDHLLVVVNKDGSLFFLSRSLEYAVVLQYPAFFAAPSLLHDANPSDVSYGGTRCPPASEDLRIHSIAMIELSGSALLPGIATPILVATSRLGIPLIYRAYMAVKQPSGSARSRLILKKVTFRDRTSHLFSLSAKSAASMNGNDRRDVSKQESIPCHNHFQNIAGRGGLFIGGCCPFFVFAERGYPRVHPLSPTITSIAAICQEDYEHGEEVLAFTEFHNIKCPRGFVSVNDVGMVRIGELPPPSVINFDAPAPMRKISLRCTPHKVAYHAGSATYGVLASMPTLTTREERLARILQSLEKHDKRHYQSTAAQAEAETGDERASRVPPLFEELHELRVYRPDTWDLIKNHKLQKGEVGLAIANMTVDVYKPKMASAGNEIPSSKRGDDGNESLFAASLKLRPKNMLVVGTGYLNGEDASSRGRLLLFEISKQEIYTEDQGVYTAFQMQLIAEKELFSPVTAVAAMEGYVIAGVGPQVSVYKLVGDEIIHLSFAFGQLYCSSISSIKQYVVAADMCKSVSFMYFRERNNSLNFLGKDYEHVTSYATEFLIENENMSIMVSDGQCNFQMMNYAHASVPESRGGKRLLINGGLNFGSRVNKFIRVRSPDVRKIYEAGREDIIAGKHSLLFATLDGGIGGVIAVTETEFKKLEKLHGQMIAHPGVPRYAGVNHDEHSAFRPESCSTVLLDQRLMDSRAIFDFYGVSLVEMRMIAREFGGKISNLVDSLIGVDIILSRF